jgi:hypothetical protein
VLEDTNSLAADGPVISTSRSSGALTNVTPSPSASYETEPAPSAGHAESASPAWSRYSRVHSVRAIGHSSSPRSVNVPSTCLTWSSTGGCFSQPVSSPFRKCPKKRFWSRTP